jgi:hypothetical protein
MRETMSVPSRQQLVSLVERVLDSPEKQQAFLDASLSNVPKLHAQIKVGQAARVFAIQLVTASLGYGQTQGQPAIALLLDELENWLGEDRQLQIAAIRDDLLPTATTTITQVQTAQTVIDTDALIEQFYNFYEQQKWDLALTVLDKLAVVDDLPWLFDLPAYQHELQNRTQKQARVYASERSYNMLKIMAKAESRGRVWLGLKELWQVYPGYDPDNLTDWIFEDDSRYIEATRRVMQAYHARASSLQLNDLGLEVLPSSIGHLEHLRYLYCSNNLLLTFPVTFCQLTKLEILHAEYNHLKFFPTCLQYLPQLRALYLKDNAIGYLPAEIGKLQGLDILDLRRNNLTGHSAGVGSNPTIVCARCGT